MTALWLMSILCVGTMGYAIQRGATCTVAAVDEVLTHGTAHRLKALLEAALWVAGGLALAQVLHLAGSMPAGYPVGAWTAVGGVLLGFGAWINRACVFGAIARLGSGEWAYLLTPIGFYVGCLTAMSLFPRPALIPLAEASPLFQVATPLSALFVLFVLWRVRPALHALRRPDRTAWLKQTVWAPHAATIVIGVSFVILLLLAGRWAYTDVLIDLARGSDGMDSSGGMPVRWLPLLLLAALYLGALLGGLTAGRWQHTRPRPGQLLRCFVGGVAMAWGSLSIPGSNDGLILVGLPLLRPYAWLAFASMCASIALAIQIRRSLLARRAASRPAST